MYDSYFGTSFGIEGMGDGDGGFLVEQAQVAGNRCNDRSLPSAAAVPKMAVGVVNVAVLRSGRRWPGTKR